MLKLTNIERTGNLLMMNVLIDCSEEKVYKLTLDANSEMYSVVFSDIPDEYRIYERQARQALLKYKEKEIPEELISSWY